VGIRKFVERVNKTHLGEYHGVLVSSSCVMRVISNRLRNPANQQTKGMTGHSNYVYFQKLTEGAAHTLIQNSTKKARAPIPPVDARHIGGQLNVMPHRRGAYLMRDLHQTPHGSAKCSEKHVKDGLCNKHKIDNTTIVHGGYSGEVDLIRDWGFAMWYGNHKRIQTIKNATAGEDELLAYALNNKSKLVCDLKRNSASGKNGVNRRIRWGVGQCQKKSNRKFRTYNVHTKKIQPCVTGKMNVDSINCPTISTRSFHKLPDRAQILVKDVAVLGRNMIQRYYKGEAFGDKKRNRFFSGCLNKEMGWSVRQSPFEYYDIQITSSDVKLHRHMDYKNDGRAGYNHTCVYSFFRTIAGVEYKVSIVMTTRNSAGSAMERFRETEN